MKLLQLLFILLLCGNASLYAQDYQFRTYSVDDKNWVGNSIQQTRDGNYLITTSKHCYSPNTTLIEGCPYSRTLMKVNFQGAPLWTSDLRLGHNVFSKSIYEGPNGTFSVLASEAESRACGGLIAGGFGVYKTTGYVLSSTGQIGFSLLFNDECEMRLSSTTITQDDQFMFIAKYSEFSTIVRYTELIKTDVNFNIIWRRILPDGGEYNQIITDQQNNNYIIHTDYSTQKLNLIALDQDGEITSTVPFMDYTSLTFIKKPHITANNELILGLGKIDQSNNRQKSFEIVRMTLDGQILWQQEYIGFNQADVIERSNQDILFVSPFYNPATDSDDVLLRVLNAQGDSISHKIYDANGGNETPTTIFENDQADILLLANSNCCNYDTLVGSSKVVLFRDTSRLSVGTHSLSSQNLQVNIYPNPTSDKVNIELEHAEGLTNMELYDLYGKKLTTNSIDTRTELDLTNFPKGIYVIKLYGKHGQTILRKLIKS